MNEMVQFCRGLFSYYNPEKYKNAIYFATDTKQIIVDGVVYDGGKDFDPLVLVEWVSPNAIKFTNSNGEQKIILIPIANKDVETGEYITGLLSCEDKRKLDNLEELSFKGSVESIQDLPTENVNVSDVYKINQAFDLNGGHYAKGSHIKWDGQKWIAIEGESGYSIEEADDKFVPWMDDQKKDILLPINGSITAIQNTETSSGGVLLCQRDYGDGNVTELGNVRNKLTLNAIDRPQIDLQNSQEKMAYLTDTPMEINFPLRSLKDQIYDKETILGWFGVSDISELKQRIATKNLMYIRFGIILSYNPMYYKMPVDYCAFESANQIKLAFVGLDTANDNPVKYEITINLDGKIIYSNSNVKLNMSNISGDSDLTWVEVK